MREKFELFTEEMNGLLENRSFRKLRELIENTPEADTAEYLQTLEPKNALVTMKIMPKDLRVHQKGFIP